MFCKTILEIFPRLPLRFRWRDDHHDVYQRARHDETGNADDVVDPTVIAR